MSAPSNVLPFHRAKLSGRRILIVEDEMIIALGLMDIVTELGASWVAAARVDKAMALATTEPFDAAILDMNLAGQSGCAVADVLDTRSIPFVIASGYDIVGIAQVHRHRPRLSKPYTAEQVEAALLSLLALPKGRPDRLAS